MSDTSVLRTATIGDAASIAATIAASFAQYRGKLVPESGAFRETAEGIAAELARGASAIVAERGGEMLGCVLVEEMEGDLYFGRLSVRPLARGQGLARRLIEAVEGEARRRGLAGVREPAPVRVAGLSRDVARGPSRIRSADVDQHAQAARLTPYATAGRGRAA